MAIASSSSRHRLILRLFSSAASSRSPSSAPSQPSISISKANNKLRTEHDPDKALSILSSVSNHQTSPISSRFNLDLTIKRLARSRRFPEIETLVESRKKDPQITQEPYLSSLIISYGHAGMVDHAVRTFDQMEETGTPRSATSFNALLTVYNHADLSRRVPELFSELSLKHSITPDKISYGILTKSLCESGTPEKALLILDEMAEKKIEITAVTYTTILDALYKKKKPEEAEKLWKEMNSKGCAPDVVAYNVKLMYNARAGKPEDVIKLMDEMVSAGLKPDTVSYNYLITCYCKNRQFDEAKKVYKGLKEKDCLPNAATYRNFMYFLSKNGDYDYALEVSKESIKKNKVPDFGTMKMLVEGLVKNSKADEAKWLIQQVRKRFPENFVRSWKKVEQQLGLTPNLEGSSQAEAA